MCSPVGQVALHLCTAMFCSQRVKADSHTSFASDNRIDEISKDLSGDWKKMNNNFVFLKSIK